MIIIIIINIYIYIKCNIVHDEDWASLGLTVLATRLLKVNYILYII